jgi:putative ABC transport system substrate-binding protein
MAKLLEEASTKRAESGQILWQRSLTLGYNRWQLFKRSAVARDKKARQRFAKELIGLKPDVILSHATPTTATLLQLTNTVPIVFVGVSDPIGSRFVESYARPSGNATGFSVMAPTIGGKWVELLKEIAPRVNRVTLLFNPATALYLKYYMRS